MIFIDSGEPKTVLEAFDEMGVPYVTAEIRFYHCEDCKKVEFRHIEECPNCGSKNITSERAGDFTNDKRTFLVERKGKDFVPSMLNKSLHEQCAKMARNFKGTKVVALDGFITVIAEDPINKKIKAWINSMRVEITLYGIHMWQCDDIYQIIEELVRLDKKCGETPQIHEKIDDKYVGWSDKKKIVCKLLDVSGKKADLLLKTFKTPWNIFMAIISSEIKYTRTGNPKGVTGPFEYIKGFGPKFIQKNKELLLNE